MSKKIIVTGAAGFIGSNLVDRLLALGHQVVGIDNFSTGQHRFLEGALAYPGFKLVEADLLEGDCLKQIFANGAVQVFHFAANADVRFGVDHPQRDLQQNTIVTFNVLEAMRANGIKEIIFPSTGSVYGESTVIPTPEDAPFPLQTSLYGASKLACEGLIAAYAQGFGFKAWIFRFVSILGERYTHGHIIDFYRKLLEDPHELVVLGNGTQKKSYLYVQDCMDAIFMSLEQFNDKVNILNLGTNEYCQVSDSVGWITEHLGLKPRLVYGSQDRGWIGDNPFIFLDTAKINKAGFSPRLSIKASVIKTLDYLMEHPWVLESGR